MRLLSFVLLAGGSLCAATFVDPYLRQVTSLIARQRQATARLTAPANASAQALLNGGKFLVGTNETPFFYEASGRAGGLMQTGEYQGPADAHAGDVVWFSYSPSNYATALTIAVAAQKAGVTVVAFGPQPPAGPPPFPYWVDSLTSWRAPDNTTLLGNVLSLWSLTGELAATTARQGRTLVFWQSVLSLGADVRNTRYAGQLFHDGSLQMAPLAEGVVSMAYLDSVSLMVSRIVSSELPAILATGQIMRQRTLYGNPVILFSLSHLIPAVAYAGSPWFRWLADSSQIGSLLQPGGYVVDIAYLGIDPAIYDAVHAQRGVQASWMLRPTPIDPNAQAAGDLVVDEQWPAGDAAIAVPGYDVNILPESGIAQLFIYDVLLHAASSGTTPAARRKARAGQQRPAAPCSNGNSISEQ